MKLFPEQKDKRRLAVTAGLLLLAAVLLFAAEALLDNLHGRPSGETESIGIDALTLSGAEAQDGSFTLSGAGSAVFDIRPADVGNVTFSIHASEDRICRVRVSLKTGACLETFVQYNLYEFFSQDGTVTVPLDARDVRSVRLTFEDSCRGLTVTDITVNAQPDGFSFNLGRYLLLFFVAALLILIFRLRLWRIRYRADLPNCRALLFFVTTLLLIPAIFCASTQEKLTEAYPLEKPVEEYGCYVQLFDGAVTVVGLYLTFDPLSVSLSFEFRMLTNCCQSTCVTTYIERLSAIRFPAVPPISINFVVELKLLSFLSKMIFS